MAIDPAEFDCFTLEQCVEDLRNQRDQLAGQVVLLQELNRNQANTIDQLSRNLGRALVAMRQRYTLHVEYFIASTIKKVAQGWLEAGGAANVDAEALLRSSMRYALQDEALEAIVPAVPTHRHKKGGEYTLLGYGHHSETLEEVAVYRPMTTGKIWVRPRAMFDEPARFAPIDAEKPGG